MITRTIPSSLFPKKRRPVKSGIERAPQRVWPRHRRFVKSFECCVPGCPTPWAAEFHHVKTVGAGGHDADGVPLCLNHHREFHACGLGTFGDRHQIDLTALAAELVRRSPDIRMKFTLLEALDNPACLPGFIPIINQVTALPAEIPGDADHKARVSGAEPARLERGISADALTELYLIGRLPSKRRRDGETARLHALLLWRGLVEEDIGDFIRITPAGRDALKRIATGIVAVRVA